MFESRKSAVGCLSAGPVLYVGIDVAKGTNYARGLAGSEKTGTFRFKNRHGDFVRFLKWVQKWMRRLKCTGLELAMEPTAGYWMPLRFFLAKQGLTVKLVPSLKVRRSKDLRDNSPLKTDEKDALVIADLLRAGLTLDYRPPTEAAVQVKTLVNFIDDLDKIIGNLRNHLEFFTSVHFPELTEILPLDSVSLACLLEQYPFPVDVVKSDNEELEQLLRKASRYNISAGKVKELRNAATQSIGVPQQAPAQRFVITSTVNLLKMLLAKQKEARKQLKHCLDKMEQAQILMSIEGVGEMTAAAIISALGDLKNFKSNRQVLKMAGLNLFRLASGGRRGVDHISRRGSGLLRRCLYMSALRHTQKGTAFNEKYSSMVNRGVAKRKVLVAIMRKILKVAVALVRAGRAFEPRYEAGAKMETRASLGRQLPEQTPRQLRCRSQV